MPLMYCIYKFI